MLDILRILCCNLPVLCSDIHVVPQIHDTVLLLVNTPLGFCLSTNYMHLSSYTTVGNLLYLETILNFRYIPKMRVASLQQQYKPSSLATKQLLASGWLPMQL